MRFDDEKEFCFYLEKHFFPQYFDEGWQPVMGKTKEVFLNYLDIHTKKRIDYFGFKNNIPTYIEVKSGNYSISNKDNIHQLTNYINLLNHKENWKPYKLIYLFHKNKSINNCPYRLSSFCKMISDNFQHVDFEIMRYKQAL